MQFTLFYDGDCPLCMTEMRQLMQRNQADKLHFVDINSDEFATHYPQFDRHVLDRCIHGQWSDGRVLTGLDVTYTAWKLVGKGWVYAPLRWPIIRPIADAGYRFFARHRHRISRVLMSKTRCDSGVCGGKHE